MNRTEPTATRTSCGWHPSTGNLLHEEWTMDGRTVYLMYDGHGSGELQRVIVSGHGHFVREKPGK